MLEKSRPVLFSDPLILSVMAGEKLQTRRIVKGAAAAYDGYGPSLRCPLGKPGGHLWVRETWAAADQMVDGFAREDGQCIAYRADRSALRHLSHPTEAIPIDVTDWNWDHPCIRWRSAVQMPRWASRITLEITSVRVERLQAITEEDAQAEGIIAFDGLLDDVALCARAKEMGETTAESRVWFSVVWDLINGSRASWASNPWVWVVGFHRLDIRSDK